MFHFFKYWILLFLFFISHMSLWSQEEGASLTPWTVAPGWWEQLVSGDEGEQSKKISSFLQTLKELEQMVPEESQALVQTAVERISQNLRQYQNLRAVKGWTIEPAPTYLESYTVQQLLDLAKQVSLDKSEHLDTEDQFNRLESVLQRSKRRIGELTEEYASTEEKSLQQTLSGLGLMVAVTSRAILEERVRLLRERLAGIEQRMNWNKESLKRAKEGLDPQSIDVANLDNQINEAYARERDFQKELLQIEAELVPNGSQKHLNTQALVAINKLIAHSRAQVEIIAGQTKKGFVVLSNEDTGKKEMKALFEGAKRWLNELNELQEQASEWERLIRREQDTAELLLSNDQEEATLQREVITFQKTARQALSNLQTLTIELFQTNTLAGVVSERSVYKMHWFSGFWQRSYLLLEDVFVGVYEILSFPLFWVNEQPLTVFKLLQALLILIFASLASVFIRRMLGELAKRKPHISSASLYTFNRVTHYVILLVGVIWALSSIGIDFSNLVIIAGALSVGIGFGLQGIVNNFLGGLIVLFDRKLRVGDFVELCGGELGHITEVNVQNTVIRTLTGHDILVPNSDIITRQLTNWTLRDPFARLHMPFGVAYGSDKEKVKALAEKAARKIEETVFDHKTMPDPNVWLVGFGDSSLDFELVVWVDFRKSKKRQSSLRAAYYWELETALREGGIEIPFPQRDVHLKPEKETKNQDLRSSLK